MTIKNASHATDQLTERLRKIAHVALDMDGTIYRGGTLFAVTNAFLAQLTEAGIGYSFLTNNSSKSTADYVCHLHSIGVETSATQIYTSTHATIEFLREKMPAVRRLFVLGTSSMQGEVEAANFILTGDSADDAPDAVLVGCDMELCYARLCRAAYWIKCGKPFLASHPDRICPTDQPTVLVDCGSICAALREATGKSPDAVLGKPDPRMLHGLLHRYHLCADALAMVGDRLYTDIAMAQHAGALSVLVLSGEATAEDATRHQPAPDVVVADLGEFGKLLARSRADS
jgi:NagD protein